MKKSFLFSPLRNAVFRFRFSVLTCPYRITARATAALRQLSHEHHYEHLRKHHAQEHAQRVHRCVGHGCLVVAGRTGHHAKCHRVGHCPAQYAGRRLVIGLRKPYAHHTHHRNGQYGYQRAYAYPRGSLRAHHRLGESCSRFQPEACKVD